MVPPRISNRVLTLKRILHARLRIPALRGRINAEWKAFPCTTQFSSPFLPTTGTAGVHAGRLPIGRTAWAASAVPTRPGDAKKHGRAAAPSRGAHVGFHPLDRLPGQLSGWNP